MKPMIAGKKLVFAPVLRAGVTFAEGMLDLVPAARVAHIGLYREPKTFVAVEYFFKAPSDLAERLVLERDPPPDVQPSERHGAAGFGDQHAVVVRCAELTQSSSHQWRR